MAAPSGHDKMATELTEEYMQVVVGGDLEPGQQVVVLQEAAAAGEEMRATSISSELLQSIAHTDTVYYVQPDGSLVAGGTLAEMTGGGGGTATVRAPVMLDAALQLKNVADHVALKQGAPSQMANILSQKQMKSICVQVQGMKSKESSEPVITKENPPLPLNMKSDSASVVPTQVIQVKTVPQPSQPLVVKAAQPPAQVPIQKTTTRPAKVNVLDPDCNEGEDSTEEHGCCVAHHRYGSYAPGTKKKGQKRKKPIKIKTRSGRISRPPKHKSKDYKFLKVGDSIQDSSVDSDDYSELSSEDEDDGGKERVYRDRQPYAVKNSLFQCQKCEKSYMGKGGLFRHYRLYPMHGQMDPSFLLEAKKGGDGDGTGEQKKPIPRPRKRLLEDPANPSVSTKETLARDGLEIVKVTTSCRGRRQLAGRKFGRPRKILRNGTVEEHATTVKELIQQCEEKDLKEQVAPSFTKLLSVYDFLLLKVKQEHVDNKPLFPYVYREFEKLHSMVKNLAEDYVINMDQNVEKPLEVTDSKVAESLGISKVMTVKAPSSSSSVTVEQETQLEENKDESSDEEAAPPPKRMKINDDCQDVAEDMTVGFDAAHCGGLGQHGNNQVMLHSETDPGTATDSDAVEQATAQNNLLVEGTESLHTQADTETDDLQEPLPSPESADASHSQDHPLNLSCQVTEEILRLQTHVLQNDTQEMAEEESSAELPPGCDPQTDAVNPEIPCDSSLVSVEGSQVEDHTRTICTSVPTTLAEAMCSEAPQVSFVEVGGTLIPTTSTFTMGSLDMSGVSPAFSLNHGQELVYIQSTEESTTEEAVVIFDNTGAAETHSDTVVALVEM